MVALCNEIYLIERTRKSGYLGDGAGKWRNKVPVEYWESSSKGQNVVDVMTTVLSGHEAQYHCTVPGNSSSTVASRAEMFLAGAWWLNSLRQQLDVNREVVFKMVKDGACGIRVCWLDLPEPGIPSAQPHPDHQDAPPVPTRMYDQDSFPISIEAIDITKLFWRGRGRGGTPFSEVYYVQKRTADDVIDEWDGREGVDLSSIKKNTKPEDRDTVEERYIEWWAQDAKGQVWYAISFRDEFIIAPTKTAYPAIPFIISSYKKVSSADVSHQNLPFLYPLFWPLDKYEYVKSRMYRLIDMYANMSPYHSGETPLAQHDATWGKIMELGPKEDVRLPQWAGQPPDIYREIDGLEGEISEGSFSQVMFGNVSSRVSGYALSQTVGADMLRTDIPRTNLELALSGVASLIFKMMRVFQPGVYMSVTAQIRSRKLAAMLEGEEARSLVVSTFIKPKQTSDEVRLATLGAQIASMPNPPVSTKYILEKFFGVSQPDVEQAAKLEELAMKNPVVTLMALLDALQESGSPYVPVVMAELQKAIGAQMPQQQAQAPPMPPQQSPEAAIAGMGMGMPQGLIGNPPMPGPTGNPSEEVGPTMETMRMGGPTEGI